MITAAIERDLDAIAFTDHGHLMPPDLREHLNRKFAPFRVYSGVEVTVLPADTHVVVFGVEDKALEYDDWHYDNLHSFVRSRGGYLILAHPFRDDSTIEVDIESSPPDGIELLSPNVPTHAYHRIRLLASRLKMSVFSNSDGHGIRMIGGFFNSCSRLPADNHDLLSALKTGDLVPSLDTAWMEPHIAEVWTPVHQLLSSTPA